MTEKTRSCRENDAKANESRQHWRTLEMCVGLTLAALVAAAAIYTI